MFSPSSSSQTKVGFLKVLSVDIMNNEVLLLMCAQQFKLQACPNSMHLYMFILQGATEGGEKTLSFQCLLWPVPSSSFQAPVQKPFTFIHLHSPSGFRYLPMLLLCLRSYTYIHAYVLSICTCFQHVPHTWTWFRDPNMFQHHLVYVSGTHACFTSLLSTRAAMWSTPVVFTEWEMIGILRITQSHDMTLTLWCNDLMATCVFNSQKDVIRTQKILCECVNNYSILFVLQVPTHVEAD